MPDYHAVYLNGDAVVRTADNGISELEWKYGCRILPLELTREQPILHYLRSNGYNVLNRDEWKQFIDDFDDDYVPSNRFISTIHVPDKWDWKPEIY